VPTPEPNSASIRVRPPWWFRLMRALLNLVLVALFGLQLFVLITLWTDKHLSLPGFARHALEDRLQDEGLRVRFRSLEVSLSGRLLLREPQIYLTGSGDPIAEADYLEIDPDWLLLWWERRFAFSQLQLSNANLYCPPESSPTGVREAFIQRMDVALASQGHRWWLLDHLHAQFLNADIHAHGTFLWPSSQTAAPAPTIMQPGSEPGQIIAARFRQWASSIVKLQPQFAQVNSPIVQIRLAGEESGTTKISATILANSANPLATGLTLGKIMAQGSFIWDGRVLRATAPVMASTDSLDYKAESSMPGSPKGVFGSGHVWARIQPVDGPAGFLDGRLARIQLFTIAAKYNNFSVDVLSADCDLRQWPLVSVKAYAARGRDSVKLAGQTAVDRSGESFDLGNTQLDFHAQTALATLLVAGDFKLPHGLETLKFDNELQVDGRLALQSGGQLDSLDCTLLTGGAHFQQINLNRLSAHGLLERDSTGSYVLDLSRITLINKSWQVDGSYFENLHTHAFRLLAKGSLDPAVLNPYLGEWWQPIWQFIVPQGEWPHADAEFSGKWDGPWWENKLFVYAQVAGPLVKGKPVDSIRVRVMQRPDYLAVYDIAAHATGGGDLSGAMIWAIRQASSHIVEQRNIFDSTLPLATVAAFTGPEVAGIVQPLDCPTPPTIHVDQRVGTAFNAEPNSVTTKMHAEFSAPFRIYNVPLEQAKVDATQDEEMTDIPRLELGIAGGTAHAAAIVTHPGGMAQLSFNLLLQNARQADFWSALGKFDTTEKPSQQSLGPDSLATASSKDKNSMLGSLDHPGLLDLALGGKFVFGQPDSLLSAGQVRIHDAKLGQLQLFGRLSQLLADTKIPLGDFDLHSAQSDLQIAHQYLRLPNLVITGPSARIQAAGVYHFSGGQVDFNTLIFPIGEWDTFLLKQIASVANPFVNTVTLKLHGTIDKPEWEISMNPMRLFSNRTVEGPPIPGIPTDADEAAILPILPVAPPLPDLPTEDR
jgi:hypothetical protein